MNYLELYDSYIESVAQTISGDLLYYDEESKHTEGFLFQESVTCTTMSKEDFESEYGTGTSTNSDSETSSISSSSKSSSATGAVTTGSDGKDNGVYTEFSRQYGFKNSTVDESGTVTYTVCTIKNVLSDLRKYDGSEFKVTPLYRYLRIVNHRSIKKEILSHPYTFICDKIEEMISIREKIRKNMTYFFVNPKDSNNDGMNFISINGAGDFSKGLEKMEVSSSGEITFSDTYDLWYARGELFNIYDIILQKNWLEDRKYYFTDIRDRIISYIINDEKPTEKEKYRSSPRVTGTKTDTDTDTSNSNENGTTTGTTPSVLKDLVTYEDTASYNALVADVNTLMEKFDAFKMFYPILNESASEFENTICTFTNLTSSYNEMIMFANNFISAYNNTGYSPDTILYDTFTNISEQSGYSLANQTTLQTTFNLIQKAFNLFFNSQLVEEATTRESICSHIHRIFTCLCYEIPTTTYWSWYDDSLHTDYWREIEISKQDSLVSKDYLTWYNQYTNETRYFFHEYQTGTTGTTLSLNLYEKASLIYAKIKHLKSLIEAN